MPTKEQLDQDLQTAKLLKKKERDNVIATSSKDFIETRWENFTTGTSSYRNKVKGWYKQYRGVPFENRKGLANVVVNETLAAIESVTAQEQTAIFSEPKYVLLEPKEKTDEKSADLMTRVLFHYNEKIGWRSKTTLTLRQKNTYGTCFTKFGWIKQEKELMDRDGKFTKVVVKDEPTVEYLDILDCAFDYGKGSIDTMNWFIIRRRVDWIYVQDRIRRGLYAKDRANSVKSGNPSTDKDVKDQQDHGIAFDTKQVDFEILEYWGLVPRWWVDDDIDITDPDADEMIPAVGEVLRGQASEIVRLERNPFIHQEIPIAMGHGIQVDNESYGIGICEITELLQAALNTNRNQLLDHSNFQLFPPLIINRAAGLDLKNVLFLPSHKILSNVEANKSVEPMRIGGNPMENVTMDSIIKGDIRHESSATAPVQGIQSNKESTAFEFNAIAQRGASRINLSTVSFGDTYLKRAYKLMYKNVQQFVDQKTAIRILGKDGVEWQEYTPEDLAGEFDITPKITQDVDSRSIVRGQMIQFISQMGQFYPRINVYKMVRKIYMLFGFDDVDEVVPPPETEFGQNSLTFEQELQVLAQGQKIDVQPFDSHLQQIEQLTQVMGDPNVTLSEAARNAIRDKIRQHTLYLQTLESLQESKGAPPGGQGGSPEKTNSPSAVQQSANSQREVLNAGR